MNLINPYYTPGLYDKSIIDQIEMANREILPITRENIILECIRILNEQNNKNYTTSDVKSKSRVGELVEIRHFASYHLRNILNLKWGQSGMLLGGRDHSTAINSYRQWDDWSNQKYNKAIHRANELLLKSFDLKPYLIIEKHENS